MKRKQFIAGAMALLLALTPIQSVRAEGGVAVDEAHFPDELFREYVSVLFDKNNDGVLSENEIEKATMIHCCGREICNLAGIEYFTELNILYCWDNKITTLDVSQNTKLKCIRCMNNKITTLDVSGCTELEQLMCENNQLTMLDVSHNPNLRILYCAGNQITNLDVSGCANLVGETMRTTETMGQQSRTMRTMLQQNRLVHQSRA